MLLRFCNFSLVLFTCSRKLSILSKVTESTLALDFTGIGEFSVVRSGSNSASLLQVLNTVAIDFSAGNLSFLDSSQSCEIIQWGEECNCTEAFSFVFFLGPLKGYNPLYFRDFQSFCTVYRKVFGVSDISVLWGPDGVSGLALFYLGAAPYFSLFLL